MYLILQQIYNGIDVIVGTPGRTLDFCEKGTLNLGSLDHVILDEVDQMLDMGFADVVEKILKFAYNIGLYLGLIINNTIT